MYSTVLFDLDHTIFDFDASEIAAFAAALSLIGLDDSTPHLAAYQTLNNAMWAAAERGEIKSSDIRNVRFERLAEQLGVEADADALLAVADAFAHGLGAHGDLYPGARRVLEHLAQRAQLGLISNGLGDVVHARVDRLGIGPLFDAIVVSSEVGVSKPHVGIFEVAFERLGDPPKATVLMVGDSLTSDIAGGTAFGIATCWYNPFGRQPTEGAVFTHEIRALDELLTMIGE